MRATDMSEWNAYMNCMLVGRKVWDDYDRGYTDALDQMDDWLDAQPSLTLDDLRPHGRWIERYGVSEYKYECSLCHLGSDLMTDFCPNCGSDMRGGGEE